MPRLPAILIALSLASPAAAKDVVVHAGALLDGCRPRRAAKCRS